MTDEGTFGETNENKENGTVTAYPVDILFFTYELETRPKSDLDKILPSLEVSFVNSILSTLFPFECQSSTDRYIRLLQQDNIVGVSSKPVDQLTIGMLYKVFTLCFVHVAVFDHNTLPNFICGLLFPVIIVQPSADSRQATKTIALL